MSPHDRSRTRRTLRSYQPIWTRPQHPHVVFFERRRSVITRAFGSPKIPRTVGCARKPANEYVSHSRRSVSMPAAESRFGKLISSRLQEEIELYCVYEPSRRRATLDHVATTRALAPYHPACRTRAAALLDRYRPVQGWASVPRASRHSNFGAARCRARYFRVQVQAHDPIDRDRAMAASGIELLHAVVRRCS